MDGAESKPQKHYSIPCPICDENLRVREDRIDTKVRCPVCLGRFLARKPIPKPKPTIAQTTNESYRLLIDPAEQADEPPRPPIPPGSAPRPSTDSSDPGSSDADYLLELARLRITADPLPPPPRWTFFSGVFTFPLYLESLVPAVFTGLALSLAGAMTVFAAENGGILALAFWGPAIILLTLTSAAYLAACGFVIMHDTAVGYDEIKTWPDVDFRDWFGSLVALGYLLFVASMAASIVRLLVPEFPWQAFWGTVFLGYPLLLMSALESGSFVAPFSGPVLRSLASLWWGWFLFYIESAAVLAATVAAMLWAHSINAYVGMLISGPVATSAFFILCRLIGRLAWRTAVQFEDRQAASPASSDTNPS